MSMTMAVYYCEDCKISTASDPDTAPSCGSLDYRITEYVR